MLSVPIYIAKVEDVLDFDIKIGSLLFAGDAGFLEDVPDSVLKQTSLGPEMGDISLRPETGLAVDLSLHPSLGYGFGQSDPSMPNLGIELGRDQICGIYSRIAIGKELVLMSSFYNNVEIRVHNDGEVTDVFVYSEMHDSESAHEYLERLTALIVRLIQISKSRLSVLGEGGGLIMYFVDANHEVTMSDIEYIINSDGEFTGCRVVDFRRKSTNLVVRVGGLPQDLLCKLGDMVWDWYLSCVRGRHEASDCVDLNQINANVEKSLRLLEQVEYWAKGRGVNEMLEDQAERHIQDKDKKLIKTTEQRIVGQVWRLGIDKIKGYLLG